MNRNRILRSLDSPILASFILSVILVVISTYAHMGNDEGIWSYIGRIWNQNYMPPYVYSVENKPPAIFELHYLSNLLFGPDYFFVRILGIISILITSFLIYFICKKEFDFLGSLLSMYIFGLVMAWESMDGAFLGQTETFMILFTVLSIFFLVQAKKHSRWKILVFMSGMAFGAALAFKQIALTSSLGVIGIFLLYTSEGLKLKLKVYGLLFILLGAIISSALILFPLFLSGVSFYAYLEGAWLILLNSGSSSSSDLHLEQALLVWTESRIMIFYPFLFLLFLYKDLLRQKLFICFLIWLFFDFIGANLSGHYYGHQIKQVVPSLALITGIILPKLIADLKIKRDKNVLALVFVITFFFPYYKNRSFFQGVKHFQTNISNKASAELMGEWLKKNTDKQEPVYILGRNSNQVLSYSKRISSSKYFNLIFVTDAQKRKELLEDLRNNPPAYIVKEQNVQPLVFGLNSFVENNYKTLETMYGYHVLERK